MRKLTKAQVDGLTQAVDTDTQLDPDAKQTAKDLIRANSSLFPQGDAGRTTIILVVLGGLVVMGLLMSWFIFQLLADGKSIELLVPILTAIIAGLVGLFVPSPVGNSN